MSQNALPVDIETLMSQIRTEIQADVASRGTTSSALQTRLTKLCTDEASPVIYSDELNYLNAHWNDWFEQKEIHSHRKYVGSLIVRLKRFLADRLWKLVFKDYIERERAFQMQLVRFLNQTARYIDSRDAEIFWQLIHKVDTDIETLRDSVAEVRDESLGSVRSVEQSLHDSFLKTEPLRALLAKTEADLKQMDAVVRGLERTIAVFGRGQNGSVSNPEPSTTSEVLHAAPIPVDYLLLENRYRGTEEEIKQRLTEYLPFFKSAPGMVVELGCGRGEFLELLRESSIRSIGIDLDEAMIRRCQEKSLDARNQDALEFLRSQPDRSLGGLFAAQLVEHLSRAQLEELLALAAVKLMPGAKIILETVNPLSLLALAHNFFRDPTHVWPLHPDTLRFMLEMKGIRTDSVLMKSPYPPESALAPVPVAEYLPARWQAAIERINQTVIRLNELLFGFQDFAIVGIIEKR